jgi:predicted TIM-barrel fold metal-dependent hydrolase
MIVDINAYYGNWPYWPLRNGDIESMLSKMDRYGIEKAFLSSLRSVFVDPAAGNREILEVVEKHPDRFFPVFSYSPYAPGTEMFAEDLTEQEVRMVKLFPLNHSYDPLEEPFIEELLTYCGSAQVPVMLPYRLMMTWRMPTFPLAKLDALAKRFPSTRFILSSINYLFEIQTSLDLMRRHSNIYLETSAMMAYREIEMVVKEIGADRLLHGTCNPLQNPAIGPMKILHAQISDAAKDRILHGTAHYLFGV